jgi:hypothetical protein
VREYYCRRSLRALVYPAMADTVGALAQSGKRRRSKRLPLSIPVRVYGRTLDDHPFRDITETKFVSVHGGLLPLTARVKRGQTLTLVNGYTGEERECRVVYVESKRRYRKVGVEFTEMKGDFWHVYSPVVLEAGSSKPDAGVTRTTPKSPL